MEEIRVYNMIPLKEMALRKVVIVLWSRPDILASLDSHNFESEIEKNIEKLGLPVVLVQQMKHLVKPIGSRIKDWKAFHADYLNIGNINIFFILKHLCWTRFGTIDYKETAQTVVRRQLLDVVKRYRLSCLYCLHEDIPLLWNQLSEERKVYFHKDEQYTEPHLEFCWPFLLTDDVFFLDFESEEYPFGDTKHFNQFAFETSAYKGNKAAAEYFFHRIPEDTRFSSLYNMTQEVAGHRCRESEYVIGSDMDLLPEELLSDVFCYLTTLMDPEQLNESFKDQPSQSLACLLDWPWHEHFLEVAKRFWDLLGPQEYVFLIDVMVDKIGAGYTYLTELFREFFRLGSSDFIKAFVGAESQSGSALKALINVRDSETIQVIFRKLDYADRKIIVSSRDVFKLFYKSITSGHWSLVELCLEEATLSKAEKEELKENYFTFLPDIKSKKFRSKIKLKQREDNWKQFLHFFDN